MHSLRMVLVLVVDILRWSVYVISNNVGKSSLPGDM